MGLFDNFPYTNFHELNLDAIIRILREMQDEWEATKTEWEDMKSFINNYFDNLDVSDEIAAKLDKMARDGSLYTIIQPDIATTVTAWLNEHISETTPPVDASLRVSGAAADALVTGKHIRASEQYGAYDLCTLYDHPTRNINGISYTWLDDGSCRVTGSALSRAVDNLYYNENALPEGIKNGDRIRIEYSSTAVYFSVYFYSGSTIHSSHDLKAGAEYIVPSAATGMLLRLMVPEGVTVNNEVVKPMIFKTNTNQELTAKSLKAYYKDEDVEVLTDYTVLDNLLSDTGSIITSTIGKHTSLIPVTPDKDYYIPHVYGGSGVDVVGCFYSETGAYLSGVLRSNAEVVDGIMTKIHSPALAKFFSINIETSYYAEFTMCSRPYIFPGRQELSSVHPDEIASPMLGNFSIRGDNKARQYFKNRKLCCIGDSWVWIDRQKTSVVNLGNRLMGWQEYVGLLYESVTNFGFSGGRWGPSADTTPNIYDGIVTAGVDLSGFDDFILLGGFNGMGTASYELGTLGTYNENTSGPNTMLGAMRGVMDYIWQQNPDAKIYLMTCPHVQVYYQYATARNRFETYRSEILRIAHVLGVEVIDIEVGAGFTPYNYTKVTYDRVHPNNKGQAMIGLYALGQMMNE